jgi:hypothetical protein
MSANPEEKQKAFKRAVAEQQLQEDAQRIYQEIWDRFDENRKRGKSFAYTNLLHDYAKYGSYLVCSGLIGAKEHFQLITQTEEYCKGSDDANTQEDAREVIGSWLRGDRELSRIPLEKKVA